MTDVFLAYSTSGHTPVSFKKWDWEKKPIPLLVSFYYLKGWLARDQYLCKPARLILDSGAYSAWNAGKEIDIQQLTEAAKDPVWNEVISLDVIGDPVKTWNNTVWMNENGAPHAYPVFHIGEPWTYLKKYCDNFPKVGLSCRFGESLKDSMKWTEQCFARAWPHKFHSFGWVSNALLGSFPFHSADTASWFRRPVEWGAWRSYGGKVSGLRGTETLVNEMQWYWDLQCKLKQQWKQEMSRWKD